MVVPGKSVLGASRGCGLASGAGRRVPIGIAEALPALGEEPAGQGQEGRVQTAAHRQPTQRDVDLPGGRVRVRDPPSTTALARTRLPWRGAPPGVSRSPPGIFHSLVTNRNYYTGCIKYLLHVHTRGRTHARVGHLKISVFYGLLRNRGARVCACARSTGTGIPPSSSRHPGEYAASWRKWVHILLNHT